jgi:hypothetical protein
MANKSNEVAVDVSFAALQITAKQFMGKIWTFIKLYFPMIQYKWLIHA